MRDPEAERKLAEEIRKLTEELRRAREQGASVSPSSYGGAVGGGGLIHKASLGFPGFGGPMGGFGAGGGPLGGGGGYGGGSGGYGAGAGPLGGGGSGNGPLGAGGGGRGGGGSSGDGSQFTFAPPEAAGTYRPQRKLIDRDLSDAVINKIAGEARLRSKGGADAVINNMFNRLGTKGWGPSRDLQDVALAPGQYAGNRRATAAEAAYIRERIRAIASGGVRPSRDRR